MGSDRARDTFDERRQYRRVVQQQGRVVLEADINEAQRIFAEEMRQELLDVVGPYGVPCDPADPRRAGTGYHVQVHDAASRDFEIGVGSVYVDGLRVRQNDATLRYGKQPDWLDGPVPSLAGILAAPPKRELVFLRLSEQEVSAVEDPTLLEPALGGPDTAQRVRLVRRVHRAPITSQGDPEWQIPLDSPGIALAPGQTRLTRTARLQVGFDPATNAYVGPENQMIRVQGAMPPATGAATATQLLWAYDNASALYSVKVADPKDLTTLTLVTVPVDANHQPRANQYAEVLQASVDLGTGAYVAALSGTVIKIARSYDPNAQTIGLATGLAASFATAPNLFLRVWENSVAVASALAPGVTLIDANGNATGLQITLSAETGTTASVVPGDYWYFAVRPATPTNIYPARYAQPQPPEGPREWACPLAVIDWPEAAEKNGKASLFDCRPRFGGLSSLTGGGESRTIVISPDHLAAASFQTLIDDAVRAGGPVTIDLMPGRYRIDAPIALGRPHAHLTIQAIGGRAELAAVGSGAATFSRGLMHLDDADGVTLRGLEFLLPEALFGHAISPELVEFDPGAGTERIVREFREIRLIAGVRLSDCANLTLEDCDFSFEHGRAGHHEAIVFGGCILATGVVSGLSVNNCIFRAHELNRGDGPNLLFGYLHAPRVADAKSMLARAAAAEPGDIFTLPSPETHRASLADATFRGNSFHGLTAAALIHGSTGQLRQMENQVHDSYGGFWIFAFNGSPFDLAAGGSHERFLAAVPHDPTLYWPLALTRCLHQTREPRQRTVRPQGFRLRFQDNSADVASTALIVWHAAGDDGGSAIVNANRLASAMGTKPTGALVGVGLASVTGNVLVNHARAAGDQFAVAFVAGHGKTPCQYASGGNAHEGSMLFPSDEDPGTTVRHRP